MSRKNNRKIGNGREADNLVIKHGQGVAVTNKVKVKKYTTMIIRKRKDKNKQEKTFYRL